MKLLELKDDMLTEGLLIIPGESGPPHINITSDGHFFLPLDEKLTATHEKFAKLAPVEQHLGTLSEDKTMLCRPKKNDHLALLRLQLNGGEGGTVLLTSMQRELGVFEEPRFKTFPCEGIEVFGDEKDPAVFTPAEKLELLITMQPGSSFRIFRTGKLNNLPMITSFLWNGFRMKRIIYRERDALREQEDRKKTQGSKEKPRQETPATSELALN